MTRPLSFAGRLGNLRSFLEHVTKLQPLSYLFSLTHGYATNLPRKIRFCASAMLFFGLCLPVSAQDDDPEFDYGKALVEANCAACHGIESDDQSAHPEAPPFRTLWERYPIDALEESFVEGIATNHPDMPQFTATPQQIAAIIDYIASLQPDL